MKEKDICAIQLDDELKKIYLCISELENERNFDDLTKKIFDYIILEDSNKKSDISIILNEASSWTKYKSKSLDGEIPLYISIHIEAINKVREIFKRFFPENKIMQIPWMIKCCAKVYALKLISLSLPISMSLETFLDMCNNYEVEFSKDKNREEDKNLDIEAKKLADVFTGSCTPCTNKGSLENICFYQKLKKYIDKEGNYKFLQNESIVAKIDAKEPYLENSILNQKWHALIATLAFLDIASFEKGCKDCDVMRIWNIGEISEIQIEKTGNEIKPIKTTVIGKKKTKYYTSVLMNKWILAAIENQYLK